MDVLRQRYADSKHSSATTTSSTPLTDLDLSNHEFNGTPTAGMTTFLPTLHSTPPMPTFQKPGLHSRSSPTLTPTSNITCRPVAHDNGTYDIATDTVHPRSNMATTTPTNADERPTNPRPPIFTRRRDNNDSENAAPRRIYIPHRNPETPDGYQLVTASGDSTSRVLFSRGAKAYTTTPLIDRIPDTPPLPGAWNSNLDRLICQIDALGFDHARIVQKVRQRYSQLGGVLTASMIDRRLRQLDQDIDIDYWRAGLRLRDANEARSSEQAQVVQDKRSTRDDDRMNAAREGQGQQNHPVALQQRQGEMRHQNWSSLYGSAAPSRDDAKSPGLRGGGGERISLGTRACGNEAENRPRTVTQDFLGGFRSHVG